MEQTKWAPNVVLVDADYLDNVAFDLTVYFEGSLVKIKVGVCRGKHTYDKKQSLKEADLKRSAEREIKGY